MCTLSVSQVGNKLRVIRLNDAGTRRIERHYFCSWIYLLLLFLLPLFSISSVFPSSTANLILFYFELLMFDFLSLREKCLPVQPKYNSIPVSSHSRGTCWGRRGGNWRNQITEPWSELQSNMIYAEQPFSLLSLPLHAISDVTLSYGLKTSRLGWKNKCFIREGSNSRPLRVKQVHAGTHTNTTQKLNPAVSSAVESCHIKNTSASAFSCVLKRE